jgi:ketosteroid isomerase-like protein
LSTKENIRTAREWLRAFNERDLEALVGLYSDDAFHLSPKLRERRPETGGRIVGKAALEAWWSDSFKRLPGLRYEETALIADDGRVVMEYVRHVPGEAPLACAEVLEMRLGRIVSSRVYHG